ncbi:MAG TPA: DUF6516 family protein [Deltaproteobacteria bacterium]|jgi:hypothetical protein|nr:DUF6516 family protein [Deltaproteobacteria bacterium]
MRHTACQTDHGARNILYLIVIIVYYTIKALPSPLEWSVKTHVPFNKTLKDIERNVREPADNTYPHPFPIRPAIVQSLKKWKGRRIDILLGHWYNIPKIKAQLIIHSKITDEFGNTIEMKLWKVPRTERMPSGIRYSLVYIVNGKRVIGYDNAEGKGDHRHYNDKEAPYSFSGIRELTRDFYHDIERYLEKNYESKKG